MKDVGAWGDVTLIVHTDVQAAADGIGQPAFGSHVIEQPAPERAPAENVVRDRQRNIIGVIFSDGEMADPQMRL